VAANYAPLLGIARLLDDEDFIKGIIAELHVEQAELEYAQQSEPALLILQAIVGVVLEENTLCRWKSIKLSELRDRIFKETNHSFLPRQIGATARRMGMTVKTSNGRTVIVLEPIGLLRACEEYGYQGEDSERLKEFIVSSRESRPKQPSTLSSGEVAEMSTSSTAETSGEQ
jgi:hypothetical protein